MAKSNEEGDAPTDAVVRTARHDGGRRAASPHRLQLRGGGAPLHARARVPERREPEPGTRAQLRRQVSRRRKGERAIRSGATRAGDDRTQERPRRLVDLRDRSRRGAVRPRRPVVQRLTPNIYMLSENSGTTLGGRLTFALRLI